LIVSFGGGNSSGGGGTGFENASGSGASMGGPIYGGHEADLDQLYNSCTNTGLNFEEYFDDSVEVNVTSFDKKAGKQFSSKDEHFRRTFNDMDLCPEIMENLQRMKYSKPTPIQQYAISILGSGGDLMATAQTGSGKTAAMMIPIINYLKMSNIGSRGYNASQKVDCIVVAPTRELATQLYDECYKFCGRNTNVVPGLCYGGTG
jgi:ATP-dependent RNA helicase DDX3X